MTFRTPSLPSISAAIRAAFRSEMPGASAEIWPSNTYVASKVFAMALNEAYERLRWLYRQLFVSTADGYHLDLHAYHLGLARKAAVAAEGYATGTGVVNATVPAGRRFIRQSDGVVFETSEAITIPPGGTVTLRLRATVSGTAGNATPGTVLVPEATYLDVLSSLTIGADGVKGGVPAESDEDLRRRLLFRLQNPPGAGSISDYIQWAESVPEVRRAFCAPFDSNGGSAQVAVVVLGYGYGAEAIPSATTLLAVAEVIDAKRPVTAQPVVTGPVGKPINITIAGLDPETDSVKEQIRRELLDMFYERAHVEMQGGSGSFPRSWIIAAIDAAGGEIRHTLTSPAADVPLSVGDYPYLGTITYT